MPLIGTTLPSEDAAEKGSQQHLAPFVRYRSDPVRFVHGLHLRQKAMCREEEDGHRFGVATLLVKGLVVVACRDRLR